MTKILIAFYGKSSAGKDTLVSNLMKSVHGLHRVVRTTTRPKRENETHGVDYFFAERVEAETYIEDCPDEVLECHIHRDWYYLTSSQSLSDEKINIGSFSEVAVRDMMATVKATGVNIKIVPIKVEAPLHVRLERALKRDPLNAEETIRRFYTEQTDEDSHDIIEPLATINTEAWIPPNHYVDLYLEIVHALLRKGV